VKHEERMRLATHTSERIIDEHGSDIIISGVYGSTAHGADTPWSDLEVLFVVPSGSTVESTQFLYRGIVVALVVIAQEELENQLITPDFG
jgi:predicted nucleotidyltransferase